MEVTPTGYAPSMPQGQQTRPLKPIIITRDQIQKEVFGMGYKNLPVLTIEEFYDQRVRERWFPDPEKVEASASNCLMDQAMKPSSWKRRGWFPDPEKVKASASNSLVDQAMKPSSWG